MTRSGSDDPADGLDGEARPVTVLVVDDHEPFRSALRDVIAATEGFSLAGEAASGEAALGAVTALSPRLVIMDKRMPGIGGIEATRLLTMRHPEVVVVVASVEEPNPQLLRCGAAAFIRKQQLSPGKLRELWRDHGR